MKLSSKKREQAALLVAEDRFPDKQIAQIVGISERTLENWKKEPVFKKKVDDLVATYANRALLQGLARRERRISVLEDLHNRLLDVIDARAADPDLQKLPGGKTGLIVRSLKSVRKGDGFDLVELHQVDDGLIREIRATQERIAKELGQDVAKFEGKLDIEKATPEQRAARLAELLKKAGITNGSQSIN